MNKDLNVIGKFAKFFLDNQYISLLLIIFLSFFGMMSFIITPKEENPQIIVPAANVIISWQGADIREMEERITKPFEDIIKDISGIEDVYSITSGSTSIITARFYVGLDKENSFQKLNDKLRANVQLLPEGAMMPVIKPIDPDDVPIMIFTFTSDVYSQNSLRDLARNVADELKLLDGTSNVDIVGGFDRRINIKLDVNKLEAFNISLTDVVNVLRGSNVARPLGDIDINKENYNVEFDNNYDNVEQIRNQVISIKEERQILLSDIAQIEDSFPSTDKFTRFWKKGDEEIKTSVSLSIAKKKGENAVTISQSLIDKLEELKKGTIPSGVHVEVTRNSGEVAWDAVLSLINNLWQAILIVIIVLFLFLGRREAIIIAISIPLSIAIVFGLGWLFGQSINRITLFALILSLGMLVDGSIVIIENISRHLRMAYASKSEAISVAVSEVGFGLISSTVTTVLAFYPMAFVTGMMGPYMAPIPFNTPNALIASLILSISIVPFLAFKMLNQQTGDEKKSEKDIKIDKIAESYGLYLRNILLNQEKSHKIIRNVVIVFIVVMLFPLAPILSNSFSSFDFLKNIPSLQFKMLPKADKNTLTILVDTPYGTNVNETQEKMKSIESYLSKNPYVQDFQTFVGESSIVDFNGLLRGSNQRSLPSNGTISVNLVDKGDRNLKSKEVVVEMRKALEDVARQDNLIIKFVEDPPGPPVRSTVLARIYENDLVKAQTYISELKKIMIKTEGVKDVDTMIRDNQSKYVVKIDRLKANLLMIPIDELAKNIDLAVDGFSPTILHQSEESDEVKIWLEVEKENMKNMEYLKHLTIKSLSGEFVPVVEVAKIELVEEESPTFHENQRRVSYVYGEMENRSQVYAVLEIMRKIKEDKILKNADISFEGEWDLTLKVFRDLGLAMLVAIFLIYFVLVAQFKSFLNPMLIMGTIPLAMIGIIPGFVLIGLDFNATSMIGTIALAGIVVNNAIIMLEYIEALKPNGWSIEDTVGVAVKTRIRPIVLTSLTTILGSLTIALGDEVWAGLGWAIIWGLLVSTVLTLLVFPVLYVKFNKSLQ